MDSTTPYLRTQSELLADIEAYQRDTSNLRWSEVEIYRCMNQALLTWADKVLLPRLYTISGGWVSGTYAYDLPHYVRPPLFPQLLRRVPYEEYAVESTTSTWQDVPGWETEPNSSGGLTLRLHAPPRTVEGRVLYYAPNSRVPITLPTTSGSTSSSATSMTLGSAVDIDDVGVVKVGAEYIQYSGVDRAASTTTLNNLVRALNGSTAGTHNTSSSVAWCVGADDPRLFQQLANQVRAFLNALPLTDGGVHETGRYEKLMNYYQVMSDQFWPTYHPVRKSPKLRLNRESFVLR